eukprot:scaffold2799_cov408-Prasinococcus_capsulatus_cf.AAC.3
MKCNSCLKTSGFMSSILTPSSGRPLFIGEFSIALNTGDRAARICIAGPDECYGQTASCNPRQSRWRHSLPVCVP